MNPKILLIGLAAFLLLSACDSSDIALAGHDEHDNNEEAHQGRTHIAAEMQRELGIITEVAGPVLMQDVLTVYGRLQTNTDKVTHINARFDGVIEQIYVGVGDRVVTGQPLLQIESNEGLNRYSVNSPVSGLITARDANAGEQTAGKGLLTIVDASSVWADLMFFPADMQQLNSNRIEDTLVRISTGQSDRMHEGHIMMWLPRMQSNQAVIARVELDNSSGELVPGSWLTAQIQTGESEVPLAVRRQAVQTYQNSTVVYVQTGDEFEARAVALGRQSADWVEVVSGLTAGTSYVTENSFIVKADIEKAGAGHDH